MKPGGGKHKGSRFENHVYDDIRHLGYWVKKTKGSGNTVEDSGDLETFNILIECKHYAKVTPALLKKWFWKIRNEAINRDKFPLLIVKENYKKPVVYYINSPLSTEMLSVDYEYWKVNALVSEFAKTNIFDDLKDMRDESQQEKHSNETPNYIG